VADLVGIQVALVAGIDLEGGKAGGAEALVIVVAGDIAGNRPYPKPPLPELFGHAEDELGFSRANGTHDVHGPHALSLQKLVILGGKLKLPPEDIAKGTRDVMHGGQS
jgi:hypothetical protein